MKCSSNPNSELNVRRRSVHIAKNIWDLANKGYGSRSEAFGIYNKAVTSLRHYIKGAPKRYMPDFETTIQGIPCGIVVTSLHHGKAAVLWAPLEDCHPEEPAEVEFFVVDRRGYPAKWLERKMTDDERADIECEALDRDKDD